MTDFGSGSPLRASARRNASVSTSVMATLDSSVRDKKRRAWRRWEMIPPAGNPDEAISGESASEEAPDYRRSHRGFERVRQPIVGRLADGPVIADPAARRRGAGPGQDVAA